jgi:saccharopine dehydrogenase-like NADP-dependent oxidoreductase
MRNILVLGAGKSSPALIDFLLSESKDEDWQVHVADVDESAARKRTKGHVRATVHTVDPGDEGQLRGLVRSSDLVVSLQPPSLHARTAGICLEEGRHFLNASYLTDEIRSMHREALGKGLTFLCEMGLDPGIDHMSAMRMFAVARKEQGELLSFRSHCGGLVSPECDDNPWHYKFSWNPRNVIMAGKDGARYLEDGHVIDLPYRKLFDPSRVVEVPNLGRYAWYPNRDSLPYIGLYGLEGIPTFVRTTLRHPHFCLGWKNLVELGLTDDTVMYDTDGMSLSAFFQIHFDRFGFQDWLQRTLSDSLQDTRAHLEDLISLLEADHARPSIERIRDTLMLVDRQGDLKDVSVKQTREEAATGMQSRMQEANLSLNQLFYLGLDSGETIDRGRQSAADILQWVMESKMALSPDDRDMVVMLHELEYRVGNARRLLTGSLVLKGEDSVNTAMARTVGLPLGIAAKLILSGAWSGKGVMIPVSEEICDTVLPELEKHGIGFEHRLQEFAV